MITLRFRIVLIIGILIYYFFLFKFLKKEKIMIKYALLWIFLGGAFLLFVIFPRFLLECAHIIGIYEDVNFLFMVLIGLLMVVSMSITIIVSRLSESNKRLVQQVAIIEAELEDLKREIYNMIDKD